MLKAISAQRTERIPEKEFDLNSEVAQGWEVIARKGGYVYIGFSRALYDRQQAEHVAEVVSLAKPARYDVDDRGNVVQFYDSANRIFGEIDREATVNGIRDQSTWIGDASVTEWAVRNGYPEVANMARADRFIADPAHL